MGIGFIKMLCDRDSSGLGPTETWLPSGAF